VRKSQSPKLSPFQFEPQLVWTMRSVLDSAVDQIDAANRTPATKAKMAERILRASGLGEFSVLFRLVAHGKSRLTVVDRNRGRQLKQAEF
jgi:hypothetical protein